MTSVLMFYWQSHFKQLLLALFFLYYIRQILQKYFKLVKNKKTANELAKVTDIFEVINQYVL